MRHGKTFRKRCLTFLLSLAMVLTSVNVPMLTVWAEEETPIENGSSEMLTTPTGGESSDLTTPADDNAGDEAGETTTPEEPVEDVISPDDGQNPVGGGINPIADGAPATPFGLVVEHWKQDDINKGKIRVVWGAPNPIDATSWEMYIDDTLVKTVTSVGENWLENTYEAGEHTFKLYAVNSAGTSDACVVTFKIEDAGEGGGGNGGDEEPKAPATPQGLEARYWTNDDTFKGKIWVVWNGVFGDGGTPTSWEVYIDKVLVGTENAVAAYFYDNTYEEGEHTVELYAVNSAGRCSTPAIWKFTLTADQAGSSDAVATDEDKKELQTLYEAEKANVDKGQQNYTSATWNAYVEAVEQAKTVLENEEATVKEVNAALKALKLAKQNLKVKEDEKVTVLISEQEAQAVVGKDVTLAYKADTQDFEFGDDYTMKINGTEADTSNVTIGESSITISKSLFTKEGNYKIQFAKTGCEFSPVYQKVYANTDTDNWKLIWQDEFSGTSLDTTKWDYQTGNGSAYGVSGWGNDEEQIYTKDNTTVADGKLTITAKKEAGGGYTSARLRTVKEEIGENGKAAVGTPLKIGTYGKVESKIKMPKGDGIWPAFWMLPHDSEYGTWAASGEIDIMEARGRLPGEVCGTIHYGDVWPANSSSGKTYYFDSGDTIEQYHVYTIEWDPTEMRWYVDGKLYSSLSNWYSVQSESGNYPYPAPFDEEFYILLNMALGGTFDSDANGIAVDENGVDMDVDYVRWYQREGGYDEWDTTQPEIGKDNDENAQKLLATADASGNFIKDGDFSQMNTTPYTANNSWKVESGYWAPLLIPDNGGSATWSKEQVGDKNYLKVAVNSVGSQTYSSQMLQYFPVVKGYSYEISYTAYTDAVKQKADVSLKIGGDDDNGWAVYSGNYTDKLTTTPTTYTHKFTMSADTDATARFEFNLATSAGNVYLSDVCVKLVNSVSEDEGEDDDKEPFTDGNHVYNGGFSNGSDGLLYWHWGTADESDKVSVVRENKERKAKITASAANPVSMWQYGMNLLQKDDYVLTFDIENDAEQDIELKVTNQAGVETYASGTKSVAAGKSTVEWQFTQPEGKTDTSGKLTLTFKGNAKIDNVKLIRTTFNNVDYDKVDLYPLANGDFSNGTTGWNIWHEKAGWETHKVNDQGQLELNDVSVGKDATFYCIGIQSSSMTLTRGVNYKVKFDYTLPEAKTYTLELCGVQQEITLEGGSHTYESEAFPGNGAGTFTLYLGPYPASNYTFILDNVEVAAQLPEKDGYKKPVSLVQAGKVKLGSDVVVNYTGDTTEVEIAWGNAEKTYYLEGVEIEASKVRLDTATKTITLDGSLFTKDGAFSFYVKAEGFVATKAIGLEILDASGNLLVNGDFSSGTAKWSAYFADNNNCGNFTVNDDEVAVIYHHYDVGNRWDIQLSQNVQYDAGNYIVTFDAWADVERPIHVQMLSKAGEGGVTLKDNFANISTEKKSYKIMWKEMAAGTDTTLLNFEMGSMTYDGVTSPNDGSNPYNIYLDNIVFRPLTADDENSIPATIASAGAGKAGADDVTITCIDANDKWKNATKTVYVNDVALSDDKVTDNKTSIVIDKSVFPDGGRYSIYVVAEGFEETNKIFKNMIGSDGNLIFGGDMNDPSQWVVYNENAENLSKGDIARGTYTLNYKTGYIGEWGWVTWSSQLKKENISVKAGTKYVLRFEAATDLAGGRDIIIEYGNSANKTTITVEKGDLSVYELEITPSDSVDDYYINFLLGPIGENLQVNGEVPHTLKIDNVTLRPASEDAAAAKAELETCIAEYENLTQGEYSDESWAAFTAALKAAKATAADENATTTEITVAINNLKRAAEKLTKPTDKTQLKKLLEKYKDVEGDEAFKEAYAYAQEILSDPEATQKEIDDALAALEEAYQNSKPEDPTPEDHPGLWIRPIPAQTYTGAAIKPEIEVYHDGKLLTIKKDYTVAYKNNTNAGTATVTVTGKGNFKDKDTATFTIEKKDIDAEDISVADVYAIINNKGKVTNPKVTVKFGKKTLKLNSDYAVTYPELEREKDADGNDKIVAKDYKITISTAAVKKDKEGKDVPSANFTGSREITYTVCANDIKLMSKAKVTLAKTKVDYKNNDQGEYGKGTEKPAVTVKMGNDTLTEDVDYEVIYENWDQIGKATVTVTAKDTTKYFGSKSVTYTVNGTKLAGFAIEGISKDGYQYTGSPIYINQEAGGTLVVRPKSGGDALTEGTDYTVSYATGKKAGEHTGAGTVNVTITGINAYTGSMKTTFKITPVDLTAFGTDKAPDGLKFAADGAAKYTKTGAKPEITTLTFNGDDLVEKQDYTLSYQKNSQVKSGEKSATMIIKGKGNFKGQLKRTYEVTIASADDVYATAVDIVKPAKFNQVKSTIKVFEKGTDKALKAGTDYNKNIKYYSDAGCTNEITADNFATEADVDKVIYAKIEMLATGSYAGTSTSGTPGYVRAEFRVYNKDLKMTSNKLVVIVDTTVDKDGNKIECDTSKAKNPYYTGTYIEPKVTVKIKGTGGAADTDLEEKNYRVDYTNNINKGKATITVTGIDGGYGGSKSVKFTIVPKDMHWAEQAVKKAAEALSGLVPVLE